MQLVNHTAVPADLRVAFMPNTANRRGFLTAKATFSVVGNRAELDRTHPLEVLAEAQTRDQGMLPPDVTVVRRDPFEVMLLGDVVSPTDISEATVAMRVGPVHHALRVFGDREWISDEIGTPATFRTMPLTWERAFGGSGDIELDRDAVITVRHPDNPLGRGFDLSEHARVYETQLTPPPGYPRFAAARALPNLEDANALIRLPTDTPEPKCWAPVPAACGARFTSALAAIREDIVEGSAPPTITPHKQRELMLCNLRHAHPDWWINRPTRGARLTLSGVSSNPIDVALPALRVFGDYAVGPRQGTRELIPQAIVVLANERRFTITYRSSFLVRYTAGDERAFRLRLEEGWYGGHHG